MSAFIRYPLPIQKKEINWDLKYMIFGGSQLIEILEKDISVNEIVANPKKFNITTGQVEKLQLWIKHNTVAERAAKSMGLSGSFSLRKSLFEYGGGMVEKLSKHISLAPYIDEYGNVTTRYSFLGYESFSKDNVLILKCHLNDYWCVDMKDKFKKRFDTYLFLQNIDNDWKEMNLIRFERQQWIDKFKKHHLTAI